MVTGGRKKCIRCWTQRLTGDWDVQGGFRSTAPPKLVQIDVADAVHLDSVRRPPVEDLAGGGVGRSFGFRGRGADASDSRLHSR